MIQWWLMLLLGTNHWNNPVRGINNFSECGFCLKNWNLAGYLGSTAQIPYRSFITYILTWISAQSLYASNCKILVVSLFTGWLELFLASVFECLKVSCHISWCILIIAACIKKHPFIFMRNNMFSVQNWPCIGKEKMTVDIWNTNKWFLWTTCIYCSP